MLSRRKLNIAVIAAAAMCGLSPVARAATEPTIGVVVPTLDSDFWNRYVTFVKTGAEQLGVNLIVLNADNKPDQMIRSIQDLIARKVDGIISVGYWDTAPPAIRFAKRANIPVVITDTYPPFAPQSEGHSNYIAFIGPGDFEAGYLYGKALLGAMKPGASGKKVIGVINGTPGTSVAIDRRKGLAKAIAEDGNVQIAGEGKRQFRERPGADGFRIPLSRPSRDHRGLVSERSDGNRGYCGLEEHGQGTWEGCPYRIAGSQSP